MLREVQEARCEACGKQTMAPLAWLAIGVFWARCEECGWDQPVNLAEEE